MIDWELDDLSVFQPCPKCGYELELTILQVRLQELIICPCCKCNVQLLDGTASAEIGKREIDEALAEWQQSLKALDQTIEIEL